MLHQLARPGQGVRWLNMKRCFGWRIRTGIGSASKQPFLIRMQSRSYAESHAAFGAERIVWRELGNSIAEFERDLQLFGTILDFASTADRAQIRTLTAESSMLSIEADVRPGEMRE